MLTARSLPLPTDFQDSFSEHLDRLVKGVHFNCRYKSDDWGTLETRFDVHPKRIDELNREMDAWLIIKSIDRVHAEIALVKSELEEVLAGGGFHITSEKYIYQTPTLLRRELFIYESEIELPHTFESVFREMYDRIVHQGDIERTRKAYRDMIDAIEVHGALSLLSRSI